MTEIEKQIQTKFLFIKTIHNLSEEMINSFIVDFKYVNNKEIYSFFKNYNNLKNKHTKLEFLLMVDKEGIQYQKKIFNEINNSYYFNDKDISNNNEVLEKLEKFVDVVKVGNEVAKKYADLPVISTIISSAELATGIGKYVQTIREINANENLRANEISHPELRSLLSAIRLSKSKKLEAYMDYYKSMGINTLGFVTQDITKEQFTSNILQATFCYINLNYKIKEGLNLLPLQTLVNLLNMPFKKNSIKFSFDEQMSKEINMFTPENFSDIKKKNLYEQMFLAQYHMGNIKEIIEENTSLKKIEHGSLVEMYFKGELPLSKTENTMDKERLERNLLFFEAFEKKYKVQLNLLSKSCENLLEMKTITHQQELFFLPNNSLVISAFIHGERKLSKIKEESLGLNLDSKCLTNIYTLHVMSKKLVEKLNKSEHIKNPKSYSLIDVSVLNNKKLRNAELKILLNKEILNEKMTIGKREKSFGEFMSEMGILKRKIKENLDLLDFQKKSDLDSIKKLVEDLDLSVDKIFKNFPNKKLNSLEENVMNLKKSKIPLGNWSIEEKIHISNKNNLNDYRKINQNHITPENIIKEVTSITFKGVDLVSEKLIDLCKSAILSSFITEGYFKNVREEMLLQNNKGEFEKLGEVQMWLRTGFKREIEGFQERNLPDDSCKQLIINGKIIGSVTKRIIELTKEESNYIKDNKNSI